MARGKRDHQLYVTVPTLFRCPISMDVMKSPVSLCTGVTYDRTSIEKWLSLGHKTCPATMQTLPSTHTTPNLTLRRLIQLWLSQADLSQSPSPPSMISKHQAADIINGGFDFEALTEVRKFIKVSDDNLRFVAQSSDAISRFVKFFMKSNEIRCLEIIVEILEMITRQKGVAEILSKVIIESEGDCLSSFVTVLKNGGMETRVKSAKILEVIAVINPESKRRIQDSSNLLHGLYSLINAETDMSMQEAGLSALLAISSSRNIKKELIRFGIVCTIGKILSNLDYSGSIIEKSMAMLETVATCTEGRGAISEDVECVVEIVKRLMKCTRAVTEHGITVLWSVCCLARDRVAQEKVVGVNGLTKVLLVMQSDCSTGTRQMCGELVKVLTKAKTTKSNLAPYETRTTHITPY